MTTENPVSHSQYDQHSSTVLKTLSEGGYPMTASVIYQIAKVPLNDSFYEKFFLENSGKVERRHTALGNVSTYQLKA